MALSGGSLLAQSSERATEAQTGRVYSYQVTTKAQAQTQTVQEKKAQAILADIQAHQHDAAYDMAAALQKLRKYGVMYPLPSYDPTFPIIMATGDKVYDKQRMKEAYNAWQKAQQ